jgi:hypothetical protein
MQLNPDLVGLLEDQAEIIEGLLTTVQSLHVLIQEALRVLHNDGSIIGLSNHRLDPETGVYVSEPLQHNGSIYDCDFCGAGPGDCHCGEHNDCPGEA